jgi:DNA invertase Pin-like site-specific DNA recombinase
METAAHSDHIPLSSLLARLCDLLQAQADALSADDFDGLERLSAERDTLVAALDGYTPADASPQDRVLLDQIGALDQRLLEMVRAGQEQATHDLRDVHRGRGALNEYQRRGQNLIRNLAQLDLEG